MTHLSLDVQYTSSTSLRYIVHGLFTCSIEVTWELSMFDKTSFLEEIFERLSSYEVVFFPISFTGSWTACCIYQILDDDDDGSRQSKAVYTYGIHWNQIYRGTRQTDV